MIRCFARRRAVALVGALACWTLTWSCRPTEHTYVDLVADPDQVLWRATTRQVDLGTAAARPSLGDGWSDQDELWAGGWSFVWTTDAVAELWFEASVDMLRAIRLRARSASPGGATVRLWLNDREIGTVSVSPSVQVHRVLVPAGALMTGANRLRLETDPIVGASVDDQRPRGIAVDWIRMVYGGPIELTERSAAAPEALRVEPGTRLTAYPVVPDGAALHFRAPVGRNHPGATLRVGVAAEDGRTRWQTVGAQAIENGVTVKFGAAGMHEMSLIAPTTAANGRGVLLSQLAVSGPRSPAPAVVPSYDVAPVDRSNAPNILVYLVDTLRADHLGTYGYSLPTSPRIDAFAADAVLFEEMTSQSGWTRASVASLMTGLRPASHGANGRLDRLPDDTITLAALLRDQGYETIGVITNGIVSPSFGFGQGFDHYWYLGETASGRIHQYSDAVNRRFLSWLDDRSPGQPFFAYLHTMDAHAPYTPPEPYRTRFAPNGPRTGLRFPIDAGPLAKTGRFTRDQIRDDLAALYDGEIAYQDEQFGRLIDELRARGQLDRTVIVFLSDHGEEFLEHGGYEHLATLYREIVHVPLIVRMPGGEPRRVPDAVQTVDVLPTLLQLAGAEVPEWAHGDSLEPLLRGGRERWPDRPIASAMAVDFASVSSLVWGGWQLIRQPAWPPDAANSAYELFDLAADPREQTDLSRRRFVRSGALAARLASIDRRDVRRIGVGEAVLDEEMIQRLRAVGYIR